MIYPPKIENWQCLNHFDQRDSRVTDIMKPVCGYQSLFMYIDNDKSKPPFNRNRLKFWSLKVNFASIMDSLRKDRFDYHRNQILIF